MNNEQYEKIKAAIVSQQAKGVQIQKGSWGIDFHETRWIARTGCACAIGCYLLETQPPVQDDSSLWIVSTSAAEALGVTKRQIRSFAQGFDNTRPMSNCDRDWYAAGQRMAAEFGVGGAAGEAQ